MVNNNSDTHRLLQIKSALLQTTTTPGWQIIKRIVSNVIDKAKQDSIDAENPTDGERLRIKAKAMQDGMRDLFTAIEVAEQFDSPEEPEWFSQLSFQEELAREI